MVASYMEYLPAFAPNIHGECVRESRPNKRGSDQIIKSTQS